VPRIARRAGAWSRENMVDAANGVARAWQKVRGLEVDVQPVTKPQLADYTFPIGHPIVGMVYAPNPAAPRIYYPLAVFHQKSFEHKFGELIDLLMSLGAREMSVEHERGWGSEFAARMNLPIKVAGTVEAHRSNQEKHLFTAVLHGSKKPELPANLVWFRDERTWQALAAGRMERGLKSFELEMTYEGDYGIDAELSRKVKKVGLKMGGDFHNYQATLWRVRVVF
jgi:hypothetical protein